LGSPSKLQLENFTSKAKLRLEEVNLWANLKTHLPEYRILQNISFEVFQGDRLVIVGTNGAGKTSLLRLLNRLITPTSGRIYLENQEYRQIPILQLRQAVTLVLQEPKLLGMTVQQAIAYPLVLRGLSKQIIQQRVSHWSEQLHIPREWLERTEVQLSVGERQLVAIARALATQPDILLLDEPTSALAGGTSSHLIHILTQLNLTHRTTILMVNHQLELAQAFCTRLLHLQRGQLLANQPVLEVDWVNLEVSLMHLQAQASAEWG